MSFSLAFENVIGNIEAGYSNDPKDSGGETIWGVTERVARANGWSGPMRDMPLEFARSIYKAQYWDTIRGDDVDALSPEIAQELFEQNVNLPYAAAGKSIQRALNVLNREQADYQDTTVDGIIGPVTVDLLRRFLEKRGSLGKTVMLRVLNSLQGAFYVDLAEKRPKDEAFTFGWFAKRVSVK